MNLIIIGVSGNIEPERNIPAAIEQLRRVVQVLAQASLLHTEPVGRPGQPTYWNTAVLARTPMGHNMLKRRLRSMEAAFGRSRTEDRYASRTLDLDVLWRNGEVQDPDVASRPFLGRLIGELLSRAAGGKSVLTPLALTSGHRSDGRSVASSATCLAASCTPQADEVLPSS